MQNWRALRCSLLRRARTGRTGVASRRVNDSAVSVAPLFELAAVSAARFRAGLPERPVGPPVDLAALRAAFGGPLTAAGIPADQVINDLIEAAEPGLVATAGPRFFGFVIGGSLPAAAAADVLTAGWDQCAFNAVSSPAAAAAEEAAGGWLKDLLGIPASASVGFVTGAQAANTVGLASAGTGCWPTRAGTSSGTGCSARRASGWSPAPSGTPRSTARCGCSASAARWSNRCRDANGAHRPR